MVASLAKRREHDFEGDRRFLAEAVERDAAAFKAVLAAYKIPRDERAPYVETALHKAALVPLEVAEQVSSLQDRLEVLERETPSKFTSDLETARALAQAALTGALANVRINLESIGDPAFRQELLDRLEALKPA
jgi:formiminotetrahydrofolate cyclodeaminase